MVASTDPVTGFFQYLWSLLSYVWDNGGAIWVGTLTILLAALIIWIILAILGPFVTRAQAALGSITQRPEVPCEACGGQKTVTCPACAGKGSVEKSVQKSAVCGKCHGSRNVEVPCPACLGNRSVTRALLFTAKGAKSETRWNFIPWGWSQHVTVSVTNTDKVDGTFGVVVTIADPSNSTQNTSVTVPSGGSREVTLSFRVQSRQPLNAQFAVSPPRIPEPCSRCQSQGVVTSVCPDCKGTGTVTQTEVVREQCGGCSGSGKVTCSACVGTGQKKR